jgi:NAD(P)-dependent dehydrogenase (short-subunit alcohol dehydrogenase family)
MARAEETKGNKIMSKVWFITGAGSGIGAEIARAAFQAGDQVIATGRNLDKVRNALEDITGENVAFIQLDVTDEVQTKTAVAEAVKKFGRIDVLVNNAGYSLLGNFEELTKEGFEQLFATNFYGVMFTMQAALPVMRAQRAGRIINISSTAGAIGFKHCSAYSATKFAVEGLSVSTATEVEQFGIKITIVEPGFFRTELLDARNAKFSESSIEDYAAEGSAKEMWSPFDGQQTGDPAKLGAALVKIANLENPPQRFLAGSDAVDALRSDLEKRLEEIRTHEELSSSMEVSVARSA